jgi:flagella basal body P-ring formation protein FlgA
VTAGRVLTWRDVVRRALVRKGALVEVAAIDGALTVTLKALAMQSGAAGDLVMVRNLESKKDITAQVVAENRVQVRF